jgi:hypothetical protein
MRFHAHEREVCSGYIPALDNNTPGGDDIPFLQGCRCGDHLGKGLQPTTNKTVSGGLAVGKQGDGETGAS